MARRIALLALAAALLASNAQATTVATHADPSEDPADPVFSLSFGPGGIVDGVPVLGVVLSGAYTEDDANGSPHAPLQLISGVVFDDWDFVFDATAYTPHSFFAGFAVYKSGPGSFAYYLAGSAHTAADLIYSASFNVSALMIPASGVGSLDSLFGTVVELTYGAASGLSGTTLADIEQFGFTFANYVGNPGTDLDGPYTATATAAFTSSAEVEVAEPCCAALGVLFAAGLVTRRRR